MTTLDSQPHASDRFAALHDRHTQLAGHQLRSYLAEHLPGGHRVVHLGCATGVYTAVLADWYAEVMAVDPSPAMLAVATVSRPQENVTYLCRPTLDVTPDRDGLFDLVLAVEALRGAADLPLALSSVRALVQPGGTAILVDVAGPRRPRRWFHRTATGTLASDLRRHRRPYREAIELYRVSTDPLWLDHVSAPPSLTPDGFDRAHSQTFPGAVFTQIRRNRVMRWTAPTGEPAAPS